MCQGVKQFMVAGWCRRAISPVRMLLSSTLAFQRHCLRPYTSRHSLSPFIHASSSVHLHVVGCPIRTIHALIEIPFIFAQILSFFSIPFHSIHVPCRPRPSSFPSFAFTSISISSSFFSSSISHVPFPLPPFLLLFSVSAHFFPVLPRHCQFSDVNFQEQEVCRNPCVPSAHIHSSLGPFVLCCFPFLRKMTICVSRIRIACIHGFDWKLHCECQDGCERT